MVTALFSGIGILGFFEFLKSAVFLVGYISSNSLFPEPLTVEEERECLEKMANGDEEAKNILKMYLILFMKTGRSLECPKNNICRKKACV